MKKFIVVLLAMLLCLSLAACAPSNDNTDGGNTGGTDGGDGGNKPQLPAEYARIINVDDVTVGQYEKRYGSDGHYLVKNDWSQDSGESLESALNIAEPEGVNVELAGVSETKVIAEKTQENDPYNRFYNNGEKTVNASMFGDEYLDISLDVTDDKPHSMALYFYHEAGEDLTDLYVRIYDNATDMNLLGEATIDYIQFGRYAVIEFNRDCLVSVEKISEASSARFRLSAILFGGVENAAESKAEFVGKDTETLGYWYEKYGKEGYFIPNGSANNSVDQPNAFLMPEAVTKIPEGAFCTINGYSSIGINGQEGSLDGSVADPDGVQNNGEGYMVMLPTNQDINKNAYVIPQVVSFSKYTYCVVDIDFKDDKEHTVAFYFADNEMSVSPRGDRQIDVYDYNNLRISDETVSISAEELSESCYAVYKVKGPVRFHFTGTPTVVFSAMFFGDAWN